MGTLVVSVIKLYLKALLFSVILSVWSWWIKGALEPASRTSHTATRSWTRQLHRRTDTTVEDDKTNKDQAAWRKLQTLSGPHGTACRTYNIKYKRTHKTNNHDCSLVVFIRLVHSTLCHASRSLTGFAYKLGVYCGMYWKPFSFSHSTDYLIILNAIADPVCS